MINAIKLLTKTWKTNECINDENDLYISNTIKYLKGIFQRDSLSVLLFPSQKNKPRFKRELTEKNNKK